MEKLLYKLFSKEIVFLSIFLAVIVWTISSVSTSSASSTYAEETIYVAINADGFEPRVSTITAGTTVIWTNNLETLISLDSGEIYQVLLPLIADAQSGSHDGEPNGNDNQSYIMHRDWLSGLELEPNESYAFTFTNSGEYRIKAGMQSSAVIYVDSAALEPEPEKTVTSVPTSTGEPGGTETPTPDETATPIAPPSSTPVPTETTTGQIDILLNTHPADGADFEFELNDELEFSLDSAAVDDKDGIESAHSLKDLQLGQHTITVELLDSYINGDISCSSSQTEAELTLIGSTVTVNLRANELISCEYTLLKDSDSDRLADLYETNNGDFVNGTSTGTDPNNADTDGDGINDGDEALGTLDGLDLPNMGANPLRKTILVEYDWYDDSLKNKGYCENGADGYHSHRPTESMVTKVRNVYAQAPTINPDGSTGIDYIQDYGQGGVFTGGNQVAKNQSGLIMGSVYGIAFSNLKAQNFASNRRGYFHYVIMAHQYDNLANFSSGQAEVSGDDLIVSVYNYHCSDDITGNTVIHELGHNLGLLHGGDDHLNNKPNYNSVMNYRFQFSGIDSDSSCDGWGDGISGYSTGNRISLDENNLDESEGVCGEGHVGFDWNNDGDLHDHDFAHNINSDSSMTMLNDHNDWHNLYFLGILSENSSRAAQPDHIRPVEILSEQAISDFDQGGFIDLDQITFQPY